MHQLNDADREAILLRYFEDQSFAEIGTYCNLKENAARMLVSKDARKSCAFCLNRSWNNHRHGLGSGDFKPCRRGRPDWVGRNPHLHINRCRGAKIAGLSNIEAMGE